MNQEFARIADPAKALPMAAYMKTDMPFYGVQKPARIKVAKELYRRFTPTSRSEYEAAVMELWTQKHRELKYAAIHLACHYEQFKVPASMPLYRRLVIEGAWWDLVDDIAIRLTGRIWHLRRKRIEPMMDKWIKDKNMWIRRCAIIGQIKHKQDTDWDRLQEYCLACIHEKEFFIRKAIGWALREYSYTQPARVKTFLTTHRDELSALSFREGAKALVRVGKM